MSVRSSSRTPRGRRALLAGGFALCVAVVPGTAWAEDDPASPAPPEVIAELPAEEPGGADEPAPQPGTREVEEAEPAEEAEPVEEAGPADGAEPADEGPVEIPPEVVAALQQFAAQAGISEDCVTGVTEALELIGNGIAGLPAELQELVTDLGAAVQESIETEDPGPLQEFLEGLAPPSEEEPGGPPAPPIGGDIAAGLEQLAETLQSDACTPAPPSEQPPTQNPPQQPPAGYQPPQAPAAPAPQAPVQPVVYPGYAPTGAEEVEGGASLVPIGLALAALVGGAVWTGRRGDAARSD